ncbi:hypothetical protein [Neptunomonas japonica]|uniref:hypothetical protein n=1 Tax=Neptunomonas japonica TaxID=417574 RepID=UPI000410D5E0|nr:hypothetical protein [Neptunomonas japonica]
MAVSKEQWNKAFDLLSQFERQILEPSSFKWDYFIEKVGASKPTMWRNKEFKSEFNRIQTLVKSYKNKGLVYSLERSKVSELESQIEKLKLRIKNVEDERDRARESLAYAAMVARRRNIDPEEFTEKSPLLKANRKKKDDNILDFNDPVIAMLRNKKK